VISLSAGKLWGLRRLADTNGRFKMTAIDQRPPIENPIREKRGTATAPWEDVAVFKAMLVEELQSESKRGRATVRRCKFRAEPAVADVDTGSKMGSRRAS
jgi:hypothetical protein